MLVKNGEMAHQLFLKIDYIISNYTVIKKRIRMFIVWQSSLEVNQSVMFFPGWDFAVLHTSNLEWLFAVPIKNS